jgi:hypothetical protein
LLLTARIGHPVRVIGKGSSAIARGWREIDLGTVGHLSLAPGAKIRLPAPDPGPGEAYRVTLDEGQICAQVSHRDMARQGPFLVEAKELLVTVVGTRFCVFAGNEPSWVSVDEGRVRVEARGGPVVAVSAGESVHSNDARLQIPEVPVVGQMVAAPVPSVARAPAPLGSPAHELVSTAMPVPGADLAAENLLYEKALQLGAARDLSGSLAVLDEYRQKFPRGVFAAEVDMQRVRALAESQQYAQALSAAEEFDLAHPGDWHEGEVQLARADLLREHFNRPASAAELYERVLASERRAALRERALYGVCVSLDALSRYDEARVRAHEYLRLFPHGEHAGELARLQTAE